MKRVRNIGGLVWVIYAVLLLSVSCAVDDEVLTCSYDVQLDYWYTREWTKEDNMISNYIYRLTEYIFDEDEVLVQVNTLPGSSGKGAYVSNLTLSPGRYTAVAWGNLSQSEHDYKPRIGVTTLHEARMYMASPYQNSQPHWDSDPDGVEANINPLFYGYTTFTAAEKKPVRIRVGMTHAHLLLEVIVKWAKNAPVNTRDFSLQLRDVPGVCGFLPAFTEPQSGQATANPIIHHVPEVEENAYRKRHRMNSNMDIARSLRAEFITNRLNDDSHPLFTVFAGDSALIKELDLEKYFRSMQISLSRNLRQEFRIQVMIYEDRVEVSPLVFSDWENGGTIGGNL